MIAWALRFALQNIIASRCVDLLLAVLATVAAGDTITLLRYSAGKMSLNTEGIDSFISPVKKKASSAATNKSNEDEEQEPKSETAATLERLDEDQQAILLREVPWNEKLIWVSRMVLGGQANNGFMRATSALQRIKRQNARKLKKPAPSVEDADKKPEDEQKLEEELKAQIMNVRLAKRLKAESDAGIKYCEVVYDAICDIFTELGVPPPEPLDTSPRIPTRRHPSTIPPVEAPKGTTNTGGKVSSTANSAVGSSKSSAASAGDPKGSNLRKSRKKKQPPNPENFPNIPEVDASGKRLMTRKEHTYRAMECLRYRMLRQGDLVAARPSSRDLWILARVTADYPGNDNMLPLDFLSLSRSKKDQMFREKVLVQDVEDAGNTLSVSRSLILPLPRSKAEAADWGYRFRKGSRVYAMYPHTTSLYTATVVDNTSYYRGDDDIVVVQFDGDEADATGQIPSCHIPASFVIIIPREFPGSQSEQTNSGKKAAKKSSSTESANFSDPAMGVAPPATSDEMNALDLNFDAFDDDLDNLDFDLGLNFN